MADEVDVRGLPVWPAAERNKGPIANVLMELLPVTGGLFLEVSSATGQHIEYFARSFPAWQFQPSDCDTEHLATLGRLHDAADLSNLLPPLELDATMANWPITRADFVYNANMMHIAPWEATEGLFRGAGAVLEPGGVLLTYGPYKMGGKHTAPSNESFDESLKSRDARWGVRDLDDLSFVARRCGLELDRKIEMPANNFCVVWVKAD